jgi:hypothetical protein
VVADLALYRCFGQCALDFLSLSLSLASSHSR